MTKTFLKNLGVLTVASMMSVSASAQTSNNLVNAKTDWSVFQESNKCWIVSAPKSIKITQNGKDVTANRSAILLFVTYDKSTGAAGEVSFTSGYPLKPNTPVKMQIGSSGYTLVPEGEWAWPASTGDDSKIRASMRRGATAVITGQSARGKTTIDTFSLSGFTAALDDAQKRCG
ncbi:hypothetical protein GCM10008927_10320 [Amylibacter ulvae]|uniref:Invasion associated locus B (IalB) protein n=1 Tax=Paramylibacter ulvae TaxID=1651968 RepID=A0ABQ3D0E6_9RHOB|nr:invasion associated locus B family protein [Amylibacter ulvae]GHA47444.1 hypothetical protein GCM10008927_10320 [Amylibacter ulvae]